MRQRQTSIEPFALATMQAWQGEKAAESEFEEPSEF